MSKVGGNAFSQLAFAQAAIVLTQFQQHAKDPGFDSGQATNPVVLATSLGGLYQKGHQCQIKHNTLKYLFLLLLLLFF